MLPDLGKYAVPVLSAYAVTIALIVGLVILSFIESARVRRQLSEAEARREKSDGS